MQNLATASYLGEKQHCFNLNGIYLTLIHYKPSAQNKLNVDWHLHDNTHISFFMSGGTVEHRQHATYERSAGDLAFYHAGEVHKNIDTIFPSKNINLEIQPIIFKQYCVSEASFRHLIKQQPDLGLRMLKLYYYLLNESLTTEEAHSLVLNLLLPSEKLFVEHTGWTTIIKAYLNENWDENPSLDELSKIAGIHPVTISKYFERYFSMGYLEYLRHIKIQKAIRLIQSSQIRITEIATICGFSDKCHFTRLFKKATGFTPAEYRAI